MSPTARTALAALAGAALTACALIAAAPAAWGQRTPALIRGGGHAGVEKEPTFRFETTDGTRATADADRHLLKVPAHYGRPISVISDGKGRPVIWYLGDDGSLRNVQVTDERILVRVVPGG